MAFGPFNYFTIHRQKVILTSTKQHRWMHARLREGDESGDHTHIHYIRGEKTVMRHSVATIGADDK